jgi:uracil-DNA glycosylase
VVNLARHFPAFPSLTSLGSYQTEFEGLVTVWIHLAVRDDYGALRFFVSPHLSWVSADRVALFPKEFTEYLLKILSRKVANALTGGTKH